MITKGIIVLPTQGFANRLRMIASSYVLSKELNLKLYVCWLPCEDCNISLSEFIISSSCFNTIEFDDFKELNNCYYGRVHTQSVMKNIIEVMQDNSENQVYNYLVLEGGHEFKHPDTTRIKFLFYKSELYNSFEYTQEINRKIVNFQYYRELDRTIGVHYRAVNDKYDKADIEACDRLNFETNSPTSEFINTISMLKNIKSYDNILVVSNNNNFISILREKFRNKNFINYNVSNFERNSSEGMKNSIIEWILLAKTQLIIGSYYSSFSDEASFLGIIPKITPINQKMRKNIKETVNTYHCINYSFIDNIAALNYSDKILINYLGDGLK